MQGKVIIGTELDSSQIDKQIDLLIDKLEGLEEEYQILENAEPFEGQTKELMKMGDEITATKKKISKLTAEKNKFTSTGFSQISSQLGDIGKSIGRTIKKVGKWALAIFGIRSAYMAVRNAINVISQDDDQLKADIDYMKSALAYAIEPIEK